MNKENRHSKTTSFFKPYGLIWILCAVLFTTFHSSFGSENQKIDALKTTQTDCNLEKEQIQNVERSSQSNPFLLFESVEDDEPTDESTEDSISESTFLLPFSFLQKQIIEKKSSINFSLFCKKQISIPLFLLYHSLKIYFLH